MAQILIKLLIIIKNTKMAKENDNQIKKIGNKCKKCRKDIPLPRYKIER